MAKNVKQNNSDVIMLKFGQVSPEIKVSTPSWEEGTVRNDNSYVPFGPTNRFPNELYAIIQQSPTASSIISGTVELIKRYSIKENYNLPCYPYINNKHDSIESLVENLVTDYMMFGMISIQVIWNKLGEIAELHHIPVEMIRLNEDKSKVWFNKKWKTYSTVSTVYPVFTGTVDDGYSQVYVYTNTGNRQTYGKSMFAPAINDITAEAIASQYIKNSLESGLASRYVIDLPNSANLPDEQKELIEKGIKEKFCGVENAGTFMIYFNNTAENLNVTKVDTDDSHEVFNSIRLAAKNNIFVSAHATPNLFGDPSSTTGFNSQEYDEAFKLYDNMTIKPALKVITNAFNTIFNLDNALEFVEDNAEVEVVEDNKNNVEE